MKTIKQIREIFSRAQMKKAIGIARASKGNYTKAYNEIEKIKKGLGDEHIVANALKKANEDLDEAVDCRTKEFKDALKRSEARKAKREASKLSEVDKIMARTNRSLSGVAETMVAAGSASTGDIEYPENPGAFKKKVKKRKGFKEGIKKQ